MAIPDMAVTKTDWGRLARRDDKEIDYSDAPPMPFELPGLRIRHTNGQTVAVAPVFSSASKPLSTPY
ncbi:hypothetical protein [Methylovulum psychrotolerans]|uniref:Uncharacterized protein n=1 Tax=Methylovulum psychrotolerans TaxID=1704499 RepID=A0A1Z4BX43_9GAMM|nr:hypothetical protein [Methylovulum psychrotolerans]ASF45819.1 hypothetical protein CEK71_06885 [Methylovulum psychrotolerans]